MKKDAYTREQKLEAHNVVGLSVQEPSARAAAIARQIAYVLCDLADDIVRGNISHVVLGMPKSKDSLLLSAHYPSGNVARCGGADLPTLCAQAETEWLIDIPALPDTPF